MGRKKDRATALQILYALEVGQESRPAAAEDILRSHGVKHAASRDFILKIVRGVEEDRSEIDRWIERCSENWSLSRIAAVERSVLRLAVCELLRLPETPERVVLNEAVELAKTYGGRDSGAFVNGILDQVACLIRSGRNEDQTGKPPR